MFLLLCLIYLIFISLGLPDSLFGSAWPVMHLDLNTKESFATVYMIIIGIASGTMGFLAGPLVRKFGTALVTIVSILLTAVGMLIAGFATSIGIVVLGSIIMGMGAGAIDTALNNYLALHYKARHMNWSHAFWGIGVTLSPLIMSFFLDNGNDWNGGYRCVSYIQFGILLIAILSIPLWKKYDKKQEIIKPEETKAKTTIKEIFSSKGLISAICALGFYCAMEFVLGTWGASYAVNSKGTDPAVAARWVSLYYGGMMAGRFISGFLSIKVSEKNLLTISTISVMIGILVFALPIGDKSLVGLLLIGFGLGPYFPTSLQLIPKRFGKKYSADLTGILMGGAYGIGWYISIAFGLIAPNTTFDFLPYLLIVVCFLMFICNKYASKRSSFNEYRDLEIEYILDK